MKLLYSTYSVHFYESFWK